MCDNITDEQNRIARELGWDSYDAAPPVVQNNIDGQIKGPFIEDPFGWLRP